MEYSYGLTVAARKWPSRTALVCGGLRTSFAELEARVDRLAAGLLPHGVGRGTAVASMFLNTHHAVELYLALARIGAVLVPINPRAVAPEIVHVLDDAQCGWIVHDQDFDEVARTACRDAALPVRRIRPGASAGDDALDWDACRSDAPLADRPAIDGGEVACILYTSGTTGKPKGVVRTHAANLFNVMNVMIAAPRAEAEVELFTLPVSGIGYIHFLLPSLYAGATVVLLRKFEPRGAWRLLEDEGVTRAFLAPTMMHAMLDVPPEEARAPRLGTVDTAYEVPDRLRTRIVERFGANVFHMYGLTEAQLFYPSPGSFVAKPGSNGKPMGLMEYRIVDADSREVPCGTPGELQLRGPSAMRGYHRNDEATRRTVVDGWVRTGDLGFVDADGDFHFTGRLKEIIKSGGYNVDPLEVENVLHDAPAVRAAAVVGVADPYWGEAVVAFVVADPGCDDEALLAHCRARLSGYKVPKHLYRVDALPVNPTGKVERGTLRREAAARRAVAVTSGSSAARPDTP
jgi:fatty-acyl-CoA synthase